MRKTNDEIILKMTEEGKSQKEIAEYFQVSPAAICKRLKCLAPMPESFENLTEKEKKFALSVAEGKSQTQAAMESHDCTSRDSAKSMGHQLMQKPDIGAAVADLMQEEGLNRRYRVQKLKSHIDHPDPNVSLKGLDQSWKLEGAYLERHVHTHVSYDDIKREQAESRDRIINSDRNFKEYYIAEIKKLHPEMDDDTVSGMVDKTLNTLFPERESFDFLEDTIEGEILGDDD